MLFGGEKQLDLDLPDSEMKMGALVQHIKSNHLKEKEELFVSGASVRPGIIVLINDTDWELLDTLEYKVADGDKFAFISTLHGG